MTTINKTTLDFLANKLGFNPEKIELINSLSALVEKINQFSGSYVYDPSEKGARYVRTSNTIIVGADRELEAFIHEIAHATGKFQAGDIRTYKTATEYSDAHSLGEGEAIFCASGY